MHFMGDSSVKHTLYGHNDTSAHLQLAKRALVEPQPAEEG